MKTINLNKQKHDEPEFNKLYEMIDDLKDFLSLTPNPENPKWMENLNTIIDFQDPDGSFSLFDSYEIPNEAVIDFIYMPTYLCTAILMKAYLINPQSFTKKQTASLKKGLAKSCAKKLKGHGYDALEDQIDALKIFMKAGLNEFLDLHKEICPEFSEMIGKITTEFYNMEKKAEFIGEWGENHESEIIKINEYFTHRMVFVYGTLMSGEANHHYLENAKNLGKATVRGYDMFDCGWYPAIVKGENLIIGELYQIKNDDIASIDSLEGEGSLYAKRCEIITLANGDKTLAYIYVYLRDTSNLKRISCWNEDYIWYVSYGSNMLRERFLHYIEGGSFENSRNHPPCEDTTPPVAVKSIEIPFDMYFGNVSESWHGSGVSFIDPTKKGNSLAVAYLITRRQFEHVAARENNGREPTPGFGWYEDIIDLEPMEGFEAKTITNTSLRPYNEPSIDYWYTLLRGIRQNWPKMTDGEIEDYLNRHIR